MVDVVSKIEMVPIGRIKPYQRNARRNDQTVAKLVEILPKVGFNVPLVLDRNNVIVKGHTRWQAARRLNMKELPCVYTDNDAETNKLDRIADNRVQEFSLWDHDLLGSELAGLNLPFEFDLAVLDFKTELPQLNLSFAQSPAASPAAEARGDGADKDELTAADLVDIQEPDYLEVLCDNCGSKFYVKR
jgi:ParB-like chromosome segregation protein Spo0J